MVPEVLGVRSLSARSAGTCRLAGHAAPARARTRGSLGRAGVSNVWEVLRVLGTVVRVATCKVMGAKVSVGVLLGPMTYIWGYQGARVYVGDMVPSCREALGCVLREGLCGFGYVGCWSTWSVCRLVGCLTPCAEELQFPGCRGAWAPDVWVVWVPVCGCPYRGSRAPGLCEHTVGGKRPAGGAVGREGSLWRCRGALE